MVNVKLNENMPFRSAGPIHYNGHWVSYGVMFTEWEMRCSACQQSVKGETELTEVAETHHPIFWLYHLSQEFDHKCNNPHDSFYDVIKREVLDKHAGKMATPNTKSAIKTDIANNIFVGSVDSNDISINIT